MPVVEAISGHILSYSLLASALLVLAVALVTSLLRLLGGLYLETFRAGFSRVGYVRFHLLAGGLLAILFLSWFGEAMELAFSDGPARRLDQEVAEAMHHGATPLTVAIFGMITSFGGTRAVCLIGAVVGLLLCLKRERFLLSLWAYGLIGGAFLNLLLKAHFQRARPHFDDPFLSETYFSFPSGHAMGSVILYGLLAYLVFTLAPPGYRTLATAAALLLGALIGISRVVLGVHFLSDVLGGWVMGAAWVTWVVICAQIGRHLRYRPPQTPEGVSPAGPQ